MVGERVSDWYSGKSILITGGTGFMGKVLIEKLLRSCPNIETIYVLCRHKNGKTAITRLAELILKPTIFDQLKKENLNVLNKLMAIEGDVEKNGLLLKEKDRNKIMEEVSVIFHLAASLKLEATIASAVKSNTKATQNMLEFSKTCKKLELFVHLSTAFCHCELDILEEKYYPSHRDPYEVMEMITALTPSKLDIITPGLLGSHPNCYTFSKRLSESVVNDYSKIVPSIIIRPSIVTPSIYEPVPGWVDSLNGPIGILVGAGKGVIRSMLCDPHNRAETIPVDIAVNSIISITANHNRVQKINGVKDVSCYNISSGEIMPITWHEVLERGKKQFYKYPFEAGLWYPGGTIRTNTLTHALAVFFLQTIPAYFIDFLMAIFQRKKFLVRLQERITIGLGVLQYFTTRKWQFKIDKGVHQQIKLMDTGEKKIFYIDNIDKDVDEYLKKVILGARQYCLKEPLSTLPKARLQLYGLFLLDLFFKIGIYYILYVYLAQLLEFVNPSFKLPLPSYQWIDIVLFKTKS